MGKQAHQGRGGLDADPSHRDRSNDCVTERIHSSQLTHGEGNPAPVFRIRATEVVATRQHWVRLRQRKHQMEAFDWRVGAEAGQRGDWLVEFRRKSRILRAFDPK